MRYIFVIIFVFFSSYTQAEDVLTIKQQIDRIMEEVKDLNRAVFNQSFNKNNTDKDKERFTSIDIRIYDLEKDIKNLTLQFEELLFKLDDISNMITSLEDGAISTAPNEDVSLKLKELEARLIMLE